MPDDHHEHGDQTPRTRTSTTTTSCPATAAGSRASSRRSATRRWSRSRGCRRTPTVRIFAKLEMLNPTGSVKDRVAKYLVEDLEARGLLHEDSIILEPTSGNTGIALAMIGRRKGYRVALVMPDNVTNERRQMAALFGAEVIDSPGSLGSNGAIALAKHLVSKDERFVMPYQYGNPANPQAHYETTGPEILADCPEIDVFVAGPRHGRHADGRLALPARAQAGRPHRRRRAAPGRARPGPALARRGVHPRDPRPVADRHEVPRLQPRCDRRPARARLPRGHLRRAVVRRGARRGGPRGRRDDSAGRSWRCSPTAAGSTCRPARSRPTSTRWRRRSRAASTGGEPGRSGIRPAAELPRRSATRSSPRRGRSTRTRRAA